MPDRPLEELEAQVGDTNVTVTDLPVEAGRVEEFACAVTDNNPIHCDSAIARRRDFEAVPAPLTFTRLGLFERYRPEGIGVSRGFNLGLDQPHVVHGEQAYEYERPLLVGDTLTGTTTLTDVYQREGGRGGILTFIEFETIYCDAADDLVLTEYVTLIETTGAIDGREGSGDETDSKPSDASVASNGPASVRWTGVRAGTAPYGTILYAEDVAAGDEGPRIVVEDVGREDFVRYAGASGDFNPIHYSEPYARAAGNPTVFGQGMLTAGIAAHLISGWLGLANVRRFQTRFQSRLWPNTTVTAVGKVTDTRTADGEFLVDVAFTVTDEDGLDLVTGEATAVVPRQDG